MSVSVSSPAQLCVNTHFWQCVPVVCRQSGSPGVPGSPFHCPLCQDGCRGWSAARAMHQRGSQGNSLRSAVSGISVLCMDLCWFHLRNRCFWALHSPWEMFGSSIWTWAEGRREGAP